MTIQRDRQFWIRAIASAVFLIATGYILNAVLRLHSPLLWVRVVACFSLAVIVYVERARFRWAWMAASVGLYVVSFFHPHRVARITQYVHDNWQLGQ